MPSPALNEKGVHLVQQVIGVCLYYARAIDDTLLATLSTIASKQTTATQKTMERINQLLDYLATNPNATNRFYASDMVLNIHSDASYLSETKARSRFAGYYFIGSKPRKEEAIKMNSSIYVATGILRLVVCSAAVAELEALFLNLKEGKVLHLMVNKLAHKQPPTQVHCDNSTATGIPNNTIKKQRSRSMEMRFFWVIDQVKQKYFDVQWQPGAENLADYFTKDFTNSNHKAVRQWYLREVNKEILATSSSI